MMPEFDNLNEVSNLSDGFCLRSLAEGLDFTIKPNENKFIDDDDIINMVPGDFFQGGVDSDEEPEVVSYIDVKDRLEDITNDGKIKKCVLQNGTGPLPGDVPVFVHYICFVLEDSTAFDSSYYRSSMPQKIKLGVGGLYVGFEIALKSMKKGELACFLIHPDYGFGSLGVPPRIPPNATLFIQIQLVRIAIPIEGQKEDETNTFIGTRSFQQIYKKTKAKLLSGNNNFRNGFIKEAEKNFRDAERILHSCKLKNETEEDKWKKMLLKVYLNMCVCLNHNSCKKYKVVCSIVQEAFQEIPELTSKSAKLLFQMGKAKFALDSLRDAERYFSMALKLQGSDDEILTQLEKVRIRKQHEKECDEYEQRGAFQKTSIGS